MKAANNPQIRGQLRHTIGWNDSRTIQVDKGNLFSRAFSRVKGMAIASLEFVFLRFVETPVNFAYNLNKANKIASSIKEHKHKGVIEQKPNPSITKLLRLSSSKIAPGGLQPRIHEKNANLSLSLRIRTPTHIRKLLNYKKITLNKIATFDCKPNDSNTINIQFKDLHIDRGQILDFLRMLKKDVEINSKEPITFTIEFSGKSASIQAGTLEESIKEVFGENVKITIEGEREPAVSVQKKPESTRHSKLSN